MNAPLFVLVASLAFATSGPLARVARPADPLIVACGRVLLAGLVLVAFDRASPRGIVRAWSGADARARGAAILGGALLAAHFGCFLVGLDTTSLPAAIALVSLEPLSVILWAWLLHGDRPTPVEGLAVVLATIGAVVIGQGAGKGEHRLFGDLLVVAAVALYGAYVAVVRATRASFAPRQTAAVVYLVAALVLVPAIAFAPARVGTVQWPLPVNAWVAIVALAAVPTLIGHTLVQTASRTFSPSTVALVSPGETMLGIAIAAVFMHARPSLVEGAGALVIVLGATLAIREESRRTAA